MLKQKQIPTRNLGPRDTLLMTEVINTLLMTEVINTATRENKRQMFGMILTKGRKMLYCVLGWLGESRPRAKLPCLTVTNLFNSM